MVDAAHDYGIGKEEKSQFLKHISSNLVEVDFALTVFSAAVFSYRYGSLVKPFPSEYLTDSEEKDITRLRDVLTSMPNLRSVTENKDSLTSEQTDLLHWVVHCYKAKICHLETDKLEELRTLTGEHLPLPTPQYLYEIEYDEQREESFTQKKAGRNTIFAYHGSKPENFYSILHHGLHAHMNKTSMYGEGTYLTVEPTVAMGFSPWGTTGINTSNLGTSFSVIALCQVIDHPSVIHKSSKGDTTHTRTRAPNSQGGDIPDKYIVVTNNDMLRVKYLLVYAKSTAAQSRNSRCNGGPSPVIQWIHRHSQILLLLFYVAVLIFIGLMNSTRFWSKVQQIYEQAFDSWGWTGGSPHL